MSVSRAGTPDQSTTPGTPPGGGGREPGPRVILVGRTGLERQLRGLGPVRVRRALDAIGELADAGAHGDGVPVVVVGADADPAGAGQSGEFVRALRRVEPAVRVLRVGGGGDAGDYDGVVWPEDSVEATMRVMTEPAPQGARAAEPPRRWESAPTVSPTMSPTAGGAGGTPFGDAELVALMLRGRDIAPAAVRLIRERSGDEGIHFEPDEGPAGESASGPRGVAVEWQGHRLGWLAGATAPVEDVAPHAHWLAAWLALAAQQTQLRGEAFSDALTGAWNRRYFDRFIESALLTAQRDRRHLTVLVFDIDDFKRYNDEFGHAAGDAILCETVRLLKSVIRPSDKVCRIGGDEFAVIFHEPDGPRVATSKPPESISQIAKRFQRQICEAKFPKLGVQAPGTLTISGGLATFPWDGRTGPELLARADELAIQGKRAGKNTIVLGPGAAEVCGTGDGGSAG